MTPLGPRLSPDLRDPDVLLFALLLALQVAAVWAFPFFPSQDGPAHLENAQLMRTYHDPDRPLPRDFYEPNPHPDPNRFSHVILAALMAVVPPLIAEKLLLTAYLCLFPLALLHALRALRPHAGPLALVAFPLQHNLFLHMGFYNFCFSLAFFFLALGCWLKGGRRLSPARTLVLAALGLALFFCHLFSLAALLVLLAVLLAWAALLDTRDGNGMRSLLLGRALPTALAFLPAVALAAWFLLRPRPGANYEGPAQVGRLSWLFKLESLVSYDSLELLPALGLSALLLGSAAYLLAARLRTKGLVPGDAYLLAALAFTALVLVVPPTLAGGLFVVERLALYPYFALVLWLAAQPWPTGMTRLFRPPVVVLAVALLALHVRAYARFAPALAEYAGAAAALEPGTTLLPWNFNHHGRGPDGKTPLSIRVGPLRHAAGYLAAHRARRQPVVNLSNYEAESGYFPFVYRPEVNPYKHLGTRADVPDRGLDSTPPQVDIAAYEKATGRRVDAVLVWSPPDPRAPLPQLQALGFERVTDSPRVQLYRRPALPPRGEGRGRPE